MGYDLCESGFSRSRGLGWGVFWLFYLYYATSIDTDMLCTGKDVLWVIYLDRYILSLSLCLYLISTSFDLNVSWSSSFQKYNQDSAGGLYMPSFLIMP